MSASAAGRVTAATLLSRRPAQSAPYQGAPDRESGLCAGGSAVARCPSEIVQQHNLCQPQNTAEAPGAVGARGGRPRRGVAAQSNAYSHAGRQVTSEVGRQNLNFGESSEGKIQGSSARPGRAAPKSMGFSKCSVMPSAKAFSITRPSPELTMTGIGDSRISKLLGPELPAVHSRHHQVETQLHGARVQADL